jgi:hypothetical protein
VVETIRLESGHTLTGIVGSNPTLSAILLLSSGARAQPTQFKDQSTVRIKISAVKASAVKISAVKIR